MCVHLFILFHSSQQSQRHFKRGPTFPLHSAWRQTRTKGNEGGRNIGLRFQGIIEFHRYRSAQGGSHEHCPDLGLSPEAMEVSIATCRRHKTTGRDLHAGGRPMAELACELAIKIADTALAEGLPRRPIDRPLQEREPTELRRLQVHSAGKSSLL